eukprot:PhF_6_TR39062/c0_g1_i2/m.58457
MLFRLSRRLLQTAATTNVGKAATEAAAAAATTTAVPPTQLPFKSVNHVTLVGVAHDVQAGFVYEDPVCQFTLSTSSLDTMINGKTNEAVLEKDHHTIRCFGEPFSGQIRQMIKEGYVVVVSGRLRLNPQLDPTTSKHHYFPYIHVAPPHGNVHVIHGDPKRITIPTEGGMTPSDATNVQTPAAEQKEKE